MADLDCKFVTLAEGIQKSCCNVYAVVQCVVQEPKITRRNTYHGICILVDPSCYEGSVKREEFCIQMFTSSKSSAAMIQYGDILVLQGITKQKCFKNPEKSEFLLRSDTDNMMVVFPNGQRDVVRVGSGIGPVPQNITMDNLCFVESLSNWHNHITIVPGSPTSVNLPANKSLPINWPIKLKQQLAELDVYSSRLKLKDQLSRASSLLAEAAAQIRQLVDTETTPNQHQNVSENDLGNLSKKMKRESS